MIGERREFNICDSFGVPLNVEPVYTIWHALAWKHFYELRGYDGELSISSRWIGNYDSEANERDTWYRIFFLFRYCEEEAEEIPVEPEPEIEEVLECDF